MHPLDNEPWGSIICLVGSLLLCLLFAWLLSNLDVPEKHFPKKIEFLIGPAPENHPDHPQPAKEGPYDPFYQPSYSRLRS